MIFDYAEKLFCELFIKSEKAVRKSVFPYSYISESEKKKTYGEGFLRIFKKVKVEKKF